MERAFAYALSVAVVAAVVSPAFRDPPYDSFPLSSYPMFSKARPDARITLVNASGVRRDGSRLVLSPPVASGNEEVLQAMVTIRRAAWAGGARLRGFCDEIAARVARDGGLRDVEAVEVATVEHDAIAYFEPGYAPIRREVHARCEVRR